jgi:hypothetical protein
MCRVIVALFTTNTQRLGNSGLIQHDSWWRPTELTSHRASARPGSKCRPHWGATIPTGRSSLRSTGRSAFTLWLRRKGVCILTICATTKRLRSPAAKLIFKRWQRGPIPRGTFKRQRSTILWASADEANLGKWLFVFNSKFLRMKEDHRSEGKMPKTFGHPPTCGARYIKK